ncbi:MAG TPA: hypothetical protein VHB50_18850, partial [Bryobacteraceae bacterium]|nr:hypothetical protein [Bryobacteraceae bacterium]
SFLIRIILLTIAISAIRAVISYIRRLWVSVPQSRPVSNRPPRMPNVRQQPAATALHMDPVCGTYVAAETSLKRIVGGQVFHFCSPECRSRFHS